MKIPLVYLVGAGPGDVELITRKGMHCLAEADCVIYDGLVNPRLLDFASPAAEKIAVAKHPGRDSIPQEQINDLLVQHATAGKTVVRLKGGDPALFARAPEEVRALQKAGIRFEIVPGITAGVAAAEYCGVFLTDREISSQVIFVTGHPAAGKEFDSIDWNRLGQFDGSIVLYMAMGNLDKIVDRLIAAGKEGDTPTVVIQDATLPQQKLAQGTLANICEICTSQNITAPAIVIIGKVARIDPAFNWFMNKPLFGKTVVMTRDTGGNQKLARLLLHQAANAMDFPCIAIQGPLDSPHLKHAIRDLGDYDWVIFTSAHGVDFMFQSLRKAGKDSRAFAAAKVACIGDRTAEALLHHGIYADFIPAKFTAQSLAAELADKFDLNRKNILLLRSAIATDELTDSLRRQHAAVEDLRIYTTAPVVQDEPKRQKILDMLQAGRIDWLTFTSASIVDGFMQNMDVDILRRTTVKIASIGPETTKKIRSFDLPVTVEAAVHTTDGLVEAIINFKA